MVDIALNELTVVTRNNFWRGHKSHHIELLSKDMRTSLTKRGEMWHFFHIEEILFVL